MSTMNLDDAQAHLREIVAGLQPGEEVVLTDNGQPLNYEHPSLLHVPRSMLDIFGPDPNLVAKINGSSVVIVRK